jgi:DNA polymerase-3 subunit delta'
LTIRTKEADLPACKLLSEFNSLNYHKKILYYLTKAFEKNALSHALLFTGIQGVGKQEAAQFLSMACNCTAKTSSFSYESEASEHSGHEERNLWPCGQCRSCQKILNGSHPDILLIKPTGSLIKIDQVRSLIQKLTLKPYEAMQRSVIICDADSMNPEAGNALLKILEEPPDRTTIILTAGQVSDLLPTIVSRCMHIRLRPMPEDSIARALEEDHEASPDEAHALARMAFGSMIRALSMKANHWLDRRNHLINEIVNIRFKPVGFILAFAERLSQDKEFLTECLEAFKIWLRDIIIYQYAPEKIISVGLEDIISKECRTTDSGTLMVLIDLIHTVQKKIKSNGNVRLSMEILIMKMAGQ